MAIVIHTINGSKYAYNHHRVGNKVVCDYIGKAGGSEGGGDSAPVHMSGELTQQKDLSERQHTLNVNQRYIDDIDLIHGKKQGNKPKKINEGDVFVIHEGGDVVYKRVIPSNPNANPDIIARKEYEKLKLIGDLAPKSVLIKQNNENIIIQEKLPIILSKSESEKWANTNLIGLSQREIEIGKDRDGNIKIFDLSEIDIDDIKAFISKNTG